MSEGNDQVQAAENKKGAADNVIANGGHAGHCNSTQVTFNNAGDGDIHIEEPGLTVDDPNFPGLTKEELLEYVNDPYWIRLRWILLLGFWIIWFTMLIASIILIILAPRCPVIPEQQWWQKSTIYQCYPKSFQDSDADGIGDLKGVSSRLDYLKDMDIDALWLTSIFKSKSETGSDVIDHKDIDPMFGTMQDFSNLIHGVHKRGMKLMLDFIPNQTSKNHSWFQQSRLGGDGNNYTDYYIWHQGTKDAGGKFKPPNDWTTPEGESAWEHDDQRKEFYLYLSSPDQPMLNLKNPHVQEEIKDILRFWLDRGVDGFRLTDIDQPLEGATSPKQWTSPLQPELYKLVTELRKIMDTRYDKAGDYRITPFHRPSRILLVEAPGNPNVTSPLVKYGGEAGAHMVTNPALLSIDKHCDGQCVTDLVRDYITHLPDGGSANWKVSDNEHSRVTSRTLGGSTRLINMLLMTLPGTPFVYYGDEIGMTDYSANLNSSQDAARSPMQWSNEMNAGFTTNTNPWIPVNPEYAATNIKAQTAHGAGVTELEVFKMLTKLHKHPSFQWGHYEEVFLPQPDIFAFVRQAEGYKGYLVAMNFPSEDAGHSNSVADFHRALPDLIPEEAEIIATTSNFPENRAKEYELGLKVSLSQFVLKPLEGVIFSWPWTY